jgi:hypothetical protein
VLADDGTSGTLLAGAAVVIVLLVAVLVVAVVVLVRLLRLHAVARDPRMPAQGKVAFWVAAVYAIFPVDVLPDPIYLDDLGVMAFAVTVITRLARRHGIPLRSGRRGRRGRPGPTDRPDGPAGAVRSPGSAPDDPRGRR